MHLEETQQQHIHLQMCFPAYRECVLGFWPLTRDGNSSHVPNPLIASYLHNGINGVRAVVPTLHTMVPELKSWHSSEEIHWKVGNLWKGCGKKFFLAWLNWQRGKNRLGSYKLKFISLSHNEIGFIQ